MAWRSRDHEVLVRWQTALRKAQPTRAAHRAQLITLRDRKTQVLLLAEDDVLARERVAERLCRFAPRMRSSRGVHAFVGAPQGCTTSKGRPAKRAVAPLPNLVQGMFEQYESVSLLRADSDVLAAQHAKHQPSMAQLQALLHRAACPDVAAHSPTACTATTTRLKSMHWLLPAYFVEAWTMLQSLHGRDAIDMGYERGADARHMRKRQVVSTVWSVLQTQLFAVVDMVLGQVQRFVAAHATRDPQLVRLLSLVSGALVSFVRTNTGDQPAQSLEYMNQQWFQVARNVMIAQTLCEPAFLLRPGFLSIVVVSQPTARALGRLLETLARGPPTSRTVSYTFTARQQRRNLRRNIKAAQMYVHEMEQWLDASDDASDEHREHVLESLATARRELEEAELAASKPKAK